MESAKYSWNNLSQITSGLTLNWGLEHGEKSLLQGSGRDTYTMYAMWSENATGSYLASTIFTSPQWYDLSILVAPWPNCAVW